MNTPRRQNEKCKGCYLTEGCMLTDSMSERCGGPWKDEEERTEFIIEHILGIKRQKENT